MSAQGTLESIAISLGSLFRPLEEDLKKGRIRVLLAELGMEFPPVLETKSALINALEQSAQEATRLPELIKNLVNAIDDENYSLATTTSFELFGSIKSLVENIKTSADELNNLGGTIPGISASDLNAFATALPQKLIEYLIVRNMEGTPGFVEAFEFVDAIERKDIVSGGITYTTRKLKIEQFFNFLTNPKVHFENLYDWGKPGFDGTKLFQKVEKLVTRVGVPAILDLATNPPVLDLIYLEAKPKTDGDIKGLEITLLDKVIVESQEFGMDQWKVIFTFGGDLGTGFKFFVAPDGRFQFTPPSGELSGEASLEWIAGDRNGDPFAILGQAGGSRLEAKEFSIKGSVTNTWNTTTRIASGDFTIRGEIKGGKFVVDFSKGDGLLNKILSGIHLESDFDIGFGYSTNEGIFFYGSAALIVQLPLHLQLGPIEISALTVSVGIEDSKVPIGLSLNLKAELGPLLIVVEQIGVKANLSFPSNQGGNLGPVNMDIGFKPPNGLGLSINAGAVIGGGYLFFDFEKEEYAGVLELTIAGFISAKAIGLVTTKMPDGSKGFSMLIIITAEFNPPFQLGYVFTLNGVGGLLGLNRTMLLDPLRNAVRTGAVNSIMFPQNVIANAPRIISDLKAIFPPYEGKFLIGPMAKIGWGTPTLVSVSLGLIIEIPGNIAILGKLAITLPDERIPLVQIQVLYVGTLDFEKKMLTFDASLFESFVLTMTLEGDMALRLKWGDEPNFLMTAGGFHPSFTPPPLSLPTLRRMAINILNTDIAKIRVECYQAVTSNTVQFGSRAEVLFDLSACSIEGHIAFDALFQFNPFYFIIELSASFKLSAAGIDVMTVRVRMSLEGPTPWRARGTGSVSLLFFEISADFDVTWGDSNNTSIPDIAIFQKLITELNKIEQWSTVLSTNKNLLVSLRKFKETSNPPLVLHPAGSLVVQQKLMPLTVKIEKIGSQKVSDIQKVAITKATSGGDELKLEDVNEDFARAQYQNLSDADKLSKPSFEKLPGGVNISLGGINIKNGKMVRRKVEYEVTIIDKEPQNPLPKGMLFAAGGLLFTHFLKGNSASKSSLSKNQKEKLSPFAEKIDVGQEGYAVAFQSNNNAFASGTVFASEMMAQTFMQEQIAKNPSLKKEIHIIPNYELNAV